MRWGLKRKAPLRVCALFFFHFLCNSLFFYIDAFRAQISGAQTKERERAREQESEENEGRRRRRRGYEEEDLDINLDAF